MLTTNGPPKSEGDNTKIFIKEINGSKRKLKGSAFILLIKNDIGASTKLEAQKSENKVVIRHLSILTLITFHRYFFY